MSKKNKKQLRREVKAIRRRAFAQLQVDIVRIAGPRVNDAGVCVECGGSSVQCSPAYVLHRDECEGVARTNQLYLVFDTYTAAII